MIRSFAIAAAFAALAGSAFAAPVLRGEVTVAVEMQAGERIVTAGVSALSEGMQVPPIDAR